MIKLGDLVRDKATGFEGIVTGKIEWVYGMQQFIVHGHSIVDRSPAGQFDERELEVLETGKYFKKEGKNEG